MWEMLDISFGLNFVDLFMVCERDGEYQFMIMDLLVLFHSRAIIIFFRLKMNWQQSHISAICFGLFFCVIQKINGAHKMVCAFKRKASIISFEMPMRTKLSITFVKLVGIIDVEHGSLMMLIHINLLFGDI